MVQDFINKNFYILFTITLFFGVVFYGLLGLEFIDELCGVFLFLLFIYQMFSNKNWEINKLFLGTLFIFLFYYIYSIYIHSNSLKAITVDFIIQLKPYLAFFCAYQLMPKMERKQRVLLRQLCVVIWFIMIPVGILGFINESSFRLTMAHPSNFASAITALATVYLYTSENRKKDYLIFICMLALGIASGRAKFYGFFIVASFVALYLSNVKNFKLNFKNILVLSFVIFLTIYVAKDKIALYFLQGISDDADKDLVARFVLYATSGQIFLDYIPFGSGFASFATHASGAYYSAIYQEYGIDGIWGLSKSYNSFISDTYYPSLAQFGFVGAALFILFWMYLLKKVYRYFIKTQDTRLIVLALIIIGYFVIENIADATFTSNRGLFFMMFLGVIYGNMKGEFIEKRG